MPRPIKILIVSPGFIPSVVICVLRPLIELEKQGIVSLKLVYSNRLNQLAISCTKWCDIAIFCRNTEERDLYYLYTLKRLNKKIIYDIDDNFFEIPLNTLPGVYHRHYKRLHVVRRILEEADCTRVYTERMKLQVSKYNTNVVVGKLYFDHNIIDNEQRKISNKIKMVYPTQRVDDPSLEQMFYQALRNVLIKYHDTVELHLWHPSVPHQLLGLNNIILHEPVQGYVAFIKYFYAQSFDIGLAPGVNDVFFSSKTNNKYREFGGCGIAGVYSNVPPYTECVINMQNGLLVENTVNDWEIKLGELIENNEMRKDISKRAYADITENYTLATVVHNMHQDIEKIMHTDNKPAIDYCYHLPSSLLIYNSITKSDLAREYLEYIIIPEIGKAADIYITHSYAMPTVESLKTVKMLIVLLEHESELSSLLSIINDTNVRVILDLSWYIGNTKQFIEVYHSINKNKMVRIIINDQNEAVLAALANSKNGVDIVKSSHMMSEYMIDSYYGAYCRSMMRCDESRFAQRAMLLIQRIINACIMNKLLFRAHRVFLLIAWWLGKRPL